ncbi:hypothetical protein KBD59_04765 [Candidatus Gracilibacteria bacterium]|nr:hypothetical protein [Candidatus Gracilibacteria bacterium]
MENPSKDLGVKRERSAAYPAISLEQAIEFSQMLEGAFGKTPFGRDGAVQAMGYSSVTGTSGSRLAALVHYGLVLRTGNSYQNSNLAVRIIRPIDDSDKRAAIQEAVRTPKLFNVLISTYSSQALPAALDNILIHRHSITKNVAKTLANTFRHSIEFAGLYQNGIVVDMTKNEMSESSIEATTKIGSFFQTFQRSGTAEQDMQRISLPSGLVILYPAELAYSFAVGEFGDQIKALESAANLIKKKNETI